MTDDSDLPLFNDGVAPIEADARARDAAPSDATPVDAASSEALVFDSAHLLRGGREVLIRHGDACYRLRHTRNDKLILTK